MDINTTMACHKKVNVIVYLLKWHRYIRYLINTHIYIYNPQPQLIYKSHTHYIYNGQKHI